MSRSPKDLKTTGLNPRVAGSVGPNLYPCVLAEVRADIRSPLGVFHLTKGGQQADPGPRASDSSYEPVPEPATVTVFLALVVGLGFRTFRVPKAPNRGAVRGKWPRTIPKPEPLRNKAAPHARVSEISVAHEAAHPTWSLSQERSLHSFGKREPTPSTDDRCLPVATRSHARNPCANALVWAHGFRVSPPHFAHGPILIRRLRSVLIPRAVLQECGYPRQEWEDHSGRPPGTSPRCRASISRDHSSSHRR
ncbi:hypothetical protein SAMN05444166_0942 [Singulisphaera sp. GP187]|nr:hypothetical protein SAMN05444166_0942 [Singulisphaera sp. GP187]